MKSLRWVGLVFSLLLGGVLVAPHGADAGTPTLTIDGVPLTVANGGLLWNGPGCSLDTATNGTVKGCYTIVGTNPYNETTRTTVNHGGKQFNNVWVWDVSSGNQARVLINDVSPGTEYMKVTGAVFSSKLNVEPSKQPTAPASPTTVKCPIYNNEPNTGCHKFNIVLQNTFNAQTATQTAGVYPWKLSVSGQFDPVLSANVINDKFRLAAQACFTNLNNLGCTPPAINTTCDALTCTNANKLGTINTGVIADGDSSPKYLADYATTTVTQTAVNIDGDTSTVNDICNTTNGKCNPTVKYDYEVWIQGLDALFLIDSVAGCGGPCTLGKATNRLLQCGDENTPGTLIAQCAKEINDGRARDLAGFIALGGKAAQTCQGTCIIIFGRGTPPGDASGETFHFTTSGDGVCCEFDLTLNSDGEGWKVFSNLAPDSDPVNGERFFTIPAPYPTKNNGQLWSTDQIACVSAEGITGTTYTVESEGNNNSNKLSLTIPTLALNDIAFCEFHIH